MCLMIGQTKVSSAEANERGGLRERNGGERGGIGVEYERKVILNWYTGQKKYKDF